MSREDSAKKDPPLDTTEAFHYMVDGLMSRFKDLEELVDKELAETVKEAKERLFKDGPPAMEWKDPFEFFDTISELLMKDKGFGNITSERLGSMGFKVTVDHCGSAHKVHKRKILGPVCPKMLFLALLIKSEFPDLRMKMQYSVYHDEGSTTEVIFK